MQPAMMRLFNVGLDILMYVRARFFSLNAKQDAAAISPMVAMMIMAIQDEFVADTS